MKRMYIAALLILLMILTACTKPAAESAPTSLPENTLKTGGDYLTFVDGDTDSLDPQCTSGYYTVAMNIMDRLVEIQLNDDGSTEIVPSLAEKWEVSGDGLQYSFHLREGVKYHNGSDLTASDVLYTFTRLLTHEKAVNQDIAMAIAGADSLRKGEADALQGIELQGDYDFTITLSYPYAPFLACLSTPGASILDEQSTQAAGEKFGVDPKLTVGTGPYIFESWKRGQEILLKANPDCWAGAPKNEGLRIRIIPDVEAQRLLYEEGDLDILDLDNMGSDAEYFIRGDIYQKLIRRGPRVGITYIALNADIKPLNDVRVRKALQLALNRQTLLDAAYNGMGELENGIFPRGLIGHNSELEAIPYDPEGARALLSEAGYENGFNMTVTLNTSSSEALEELFSLVTDMWRRVGVKAVIERVDEETFMERRNAGELACYASTWSADFNDPDNFIYTFFGSGENTRRRSLNYANEAVIKRVQDARAIVDTDQRILEYQALERIIAQEDCAWIPLFSREHLFVVNPRVEGFKVSWNGWSSNYYREVSVNA